MILAVLGLCAGAHAVGAAPAKTPPNIVWFLTDDQDQMLGASFPPTAPGGATPMPKTKAKMADMGATATNFFIHTPICCPSRSELISGRYFHNIKTNHAPACMHVNENLVNNNTFAKYLAEAGYTVGMFGKYLNNVPNFRPVGFDQWMANGGGDYIAPSFQMYDIPSVPESAGKLYAWHGTDDAANYSTAVIGNMSMAFIRKAVSEQKPFMAYIAPKAAHEPFNPAPWYVGHWDDSWPAQEPRPPNWNASFESRKDHHGNIATEPLITDAEAAVITGVFKDRWRTLMSVDDVIGDVIDLCESLNVADNTYFLYSSDHGFQLGEFNIAMDKRNVYDWNTRIHLLARGPGIPHGVEWKEPATQVDIAPTFLGFAGVAKPEQMDGKSLVPLLTHPSLRHELNPTTVQHLERHLDALSTEGDLAYKAAWRDCVFIEYYYNDYNAKCMGDCTPPAVGFPDRDSGCVDLESEPNSVCWQGCKSNCYQTETPANNYIAIRNMPGSAMGDTLYAEYQSGASNQSWTNMINIDFDKVDFVEYYDSSTDPWQMKNLHKTAAKDTLSALHEKVQSWYRCKGDACP